MRRRKRLSHALRPYRPDFPSPMEFYSHLDWLDGSPLTSVIERYRAQLLERALYTFDPDGTPTYNLVVCGRAKKNWKTTDACLALLYRFLVPPASPQGSDIFLLANDGDQAKDDLVLIQKLVRANKVLSDEVTMQSNRIGRRDGRGVMRVLPAGDVLGAHGISYQTVAFDEVHGYRTWELFEALQPDPHRPDALQWITSYASIYNSEGNPLHDLIKMGKAGDDPRMLFSWYAADYCTDREHDRRSNSGEERANPSLGSFPTGMRYLVQQRRRLPTSKFRRLHLNLSGAPDGAAFDGALIQKAIVPGRKSNKPRPGCRYTAFVDMSHGSGDDASLAIAHREDDRAVLDKITDQLKRPPFNPLVAVRRFAQVLKRYGCTSVIGDRVGGEVYRQEFAEFGIRYRIAPMTKHELYEGFEPILNAGECELLDQPKLIEQAQTLVWKGKRIDHQSGDHDDWINACCGALVLASRVPRKIDWSLYSAEDVGEPELMPDDFDPKWKSQFVPGNAQDW